METWTRKHSLTTNCFFPWLYKLHMSKKWRPARVSSPDMFLSQYSPIFRYERSGKTEISRGFHPEFNSVRGASHDVLQIGIHRHENEQRILYIDSFLGKIENHTNLCRWLTMPQNPGFAVPTPPVGHAFGSSLASHKTVILSATGFRSKGDARSVPIVTCVSVPTLYHGSKIEGVFKPPDSKPEQSIQTNRLIHSHTASH